MSLPTAAAVDALLCGCHIRSIVLYQGGLFELVSAAATNKADDADVAFLDHASGSEWPPGLFSFAKGAQCPTFDVQHGEGKVSYSVHSILSQACPVLPQATGLCPLLKNSRGRLIPSLVPDITVSPSCKPPLDALPDSIDLLRTTLALASGCHMRWLCCLRTKSATAVNASSELGGANMNGQHVLQQLTYQGVIAATRVPRSAFAIRLPLAVFYSTYRACLPDCGRSISEKDYIAAFTNLLSTSSISQSSGKISSTKVLLSAEAYAQLNQLRTSFLAKWALISQRAGRGYLARLTAYTAYYAANKKRLELQAQEVAARKLEEERLRREEDRRVLMEQQELNRRMAVQRNHAAVIIQKIVKGIQQRKKFARDLLAQKRAEFEMHDDSTMLAFHNIWRKQDEIDYRVEAKDTADYASYTRHISHLVLSHEQTRMQLGMCHECVLACKLWMHVPTLNRAFDILPFCAACSHTYLL